MDLKRISIIAVLLVFIYAGYDTVSIVENMRINSFGLINSEQHIIAVQHFDIDYSTNDVLNPKNLPIVIFKNNKHGYEISNKFYGSQDPKTKPSGPISISNERSLFSIPWNDSYVRIYAFMNKQAKQIQRVYSPNVTKAFLSDDGNIFFHEEGQMLRMYHYSSLSLLYIPVFNLSMNSRGNVYGVSPDALCLVSYESKVNVYEYKNEKWEVTSNEKQQVIPELKAGSIQSIYVSNLTPNNDRSVLFLTLEQKTEYIIPNNPYSGSKSVIAYRLIYCKLKGPYLSFVQVVDTYEQNPIIYLTKNGMLIGTTFSSYSYIKSIFLYKYQSDISKFELHNTFWNFKNYLNKIYVSEDASMVVGSSQLSKNQTNQQLVFHIYCNVQNCKKCQWRKSCLQCNQGFIKHGDFCGCPNHHSLYNKQCIECANSHCISCQKSNVCFRCGEGYSLVEGYCLCPSFKSISSISGKCVSCQVQNCVKCEVQNVCSEFSTDSKQKHVTFIADKRENLNQVSKVHTQESVHLIEERIGEEETEANKKGDLTISITQEEQVGSIILLFCLLAIGCLCMRLKTMKKRLRSAKSNNNQSNENKRLQSLNYIQKTQVLKMQQGNQP